MWYVNGVRVKSTSDSAQVDRGHLTYLPLAGIEMATASGLGMVLIISVACNAINFTHSFDLVTTYDYNNCTSKVIK